jgi:hypothetical protein
MGNATTAKATLDQPLLAGSRSMGVAVDTSGILTGTVVRSNPHWHASLREGT